MFEDIFKAGQEKKQQEQMLQAEHRARAADKEQAVLMSSTHPDDDRNYYDEQNRKSDLIRWQQELDSELFELVLHFLSQKIDDEGKISNVLDEKGKPLDPMCNKLFIQQVILPKLKPFLSKNLINSNLDRDEILATQKYTSKDITNMMSDNWDKYAIDFVNFDGIKRDIKNIMKASIWRAYKGWTKNTDSSSIKRIESENFNTQEQEKRGLKQLFKGA